MAWLRIDDRARTHPKIIQAGPSAAWLWFCGLSYCREQLTDGVIDKKLVGSLAVGLTKPRHYAKKLVLCGLWIDRGSHYEVHDFLDWNPTRAEIIAQRKADSDRKRPSRGQQDVQMDSDRNPNGFQKDSSHARAGDAGSGLVLGTEDLSEEKSARRETNGHAHVNGWVAPHGNPHANPLNLVNGADARIHGQHAWCAEGRPSLCVLHSQHKAHLGAMQCSEDEVKAFYARTIARYEGQPIGDTRFKFWDNAVAAEIGTVTSASPKKALSERQREGRAQLQAFRAAQKGVSRVS